MSGERNYYVEACTAADDKDGAKLRRIMRALVRHAVMEALEFEPRGDEPARRIARKLVHK